MYKLSPQALKTGMVTYEDIYSPKKELLIKSNTSLTEEKIRLLGEYNFSEIALCEPDEVNMTHYELLHGHPHFQNFNNLYTLSLNSFMNLVRVLNTGLDLNLTKMLTLRDDVMASVMDGEQLFDYLYNMMPNENEITYNHCFNCGLLCYVVGTWLGMKGDDLDNLTLSGFLFDIGKTKISDQLLWKPDKLSPEELIQMQHHIHLGYELLKNRQLPPHVISVMIMHHERCDGSGYPARIKESRIDPFALIVAIVDTYEAMTHPRAQRAALTPFQAFREFERQGFDKYGKNIKPILTRIANIYVDRRVSLTGNIAGRITQINEDNLSRPVVFVGSAYHDLQTTPNTEIIRMI